MSTAVIMTILWGRNWNESVALSVRLSFICFSYSPHRLEPCGKDFHSLRLEYFDVKLYLPLFEITHTHTHTQTNSHTQFLMSKTTEACNLLFPFAVEPRFIAMLLHNNKSSFDHAGKSIRKYHFKRRNCHDVITTGIIVKTEGK
jgi:hypothetical protein